MGSSSLPAVVVVMLPERTAMNHVLDSGLLVSSSLQNLGYNAFFDRQRASLAEPVEPARVTAGGRGVLQLLTADGPRRAMVSGRLLHASEGSALPAVGDWVGLRPDDAEPGVITHVFTRRT